MKNTGWVVEAALKQMKNSAHKGMEALLASMIPKGTKSNPNRLGNSASSRALKAKS